MMKKIIGFLIASIVVFGLAILVLFCCTLIAFAQTSGTAEPVPIDWVGVIIAVATPLITFGAAWTLQKLILIRGDVLVGVVVPLIGALSTGITQLLAAGHLSVYVQVALSLVAVYLSQVQIQRQKAAEATANSIAKK